MQLQAYGLRPQQKHSLWSCDISSSPFYLRRHEASSLDFVHHPVVDRRKLVFT
jgi:hypothetical protein